MNTDNNGKIIQVASSGMIPIGNYGAPPQVSQPRESADPVITDHYRSSSQENPTGIDAGDTAVLSTDKNSSPSDDVDTVTILYTNDIHGKLMPWNGVGGAVNLSGTISKIRKEKPDALLVDGGDFAYNPPFSTAKNFSPMDRIMKENRYDAIGLGNHEFQYESDVFGGVRGNPNPDLTDNLYELAQATETPLINCNAVLKDTGERPEYVQPFIIKDVNGVKVGFTSFVLEKLATKNHPHVGEEWEVQDAAESLNRTIPQMKQAGADLIVVLGHDNLKNNKRVIGKTTGINVMLGGHDHMATHEPIMTKDADGVEVPLLEAGSMGRLVGELNLSVSRSDKKIIGINNTLHKVTGDNAHEADPDIVNIVNEWKDKLPKIDKYEDRYPFHYLKTDEEYSAAEGLDMERLNPKEKDKIIKERINKGE